MINRVVLVGRITKDIELKQTQTGVSVASFTLAVNRTFKKEGQLDADFVPVVVWRKQAENVVRYVGKGSLVGVEGRLQTRSYDAADGSKRFVMEVVANSVQFLDSRNQSENETPKTTNKSNQRQPAMQDEMNFDFDDNTFDISDDDLPF